MAQLEVMLTGLEVIPNYGLYAGFRNLGGVYFPDWKHLFVTRMLGRRKDRDRSKRIEEIRKKIDSNPKLKEVITRIRDKYWVIYQAYCPVRLRDELPKEFVRGHYTQQARWRLKAPGNMVSIGENTREILVKRKEISAKLEELVIKIQSSRKKSHATRIFNDLNDLFANYDGTNYLEILKQARKTPTLKELDQEILDLRKEIGNSILSSNVLAANSGKITFEKTNTSSRDRRLRVEAKDYSYLKKGHMPSGEELWNKKWTFLDIEIPFFRREEARISWVGVRHINHGEVEKSKIYTLYDLGIKQIEGYRIITCRDEEDLIAMLAQDISEENPDVVSSYNSRFDFIKLRENQSGFPIGNDDTNPVLKVTTRFFERVGVKGRLLIDPMRWQKLARPHDPNAKLEMASGFEKANSYDDLEKLEDRICNGDKSAGVEEARYLASDVTHLTDLFFLQEFKRDLGVACWISENFGVGLERIMHSANCINDVQEKGYFSELGIYREEVPPHLRTKKMQERKSKAREKLKDIISAEYISQGEIKGLVKDVYKVSIPIGDFFREVIIRRFPGAGRFYDYVDQFKGDKKTLLFLEQFSREISRWLREDYGTYLIDERKFDELTKKIDMPKFEDIYHRVRRALQERDELKQLDNGCITKQNLRRNIDSETQDFMRSNGLSLEQFRELVNQRSVIKRRARNVIGNYDAFPSNRFFNVDKYRDPANICIIKEVVRKKTEAINQFFSIHGLNIVAREGYFLYLTGNRNALDSRDCPVILADTISRLYNADRPYYLKNGFFSHMKLKDEPDFHLSIFEIRAFREVLTNLLDGRDEAAIEIYKKKLGELKGGGVKLEDLTYYNKSRDEFAVYALIGENQEIQLGHPERRKSNKLYFVRTAREGVEIKVDEQNGWKYFNDEEDGRKVYVSPENISPDLKVYERRFAKRMKDILDPVMPKSNNRHGTRKMRVNIGETQLRLDL